MRFTAFIAFVLLLGIASAGQLLPNFCSNLFQSAQATASSGLFTASAQRSLISISMLIVFGVLLALGIVYAVGTAFGMDSLKRFVSTELPESIFNIVILAFVAGGIITTASVGFTYNSIAFITNLGAIGSNTIGIPAPTINSAQGLYLSTCNNYIGVVSDLTSGVLPYIIALSVQQFYLNTLSTLEIDLEPSGFGFTFVPYAGLAPMAKLIEIQTDLLFLLTGLFIAIPIFLYLVYFLFPYFLYTGVLLRTFPWTRAAGGTLIALFISFYIIFPALLYPFSAYQPNYGCSTSVQSTLFGLCLPALLADPAGAFTSFSLSAALSGVPIVGQLTGGSAIGNALTAEISSFAEVVGILGLQALGILIALIVSFDLLEALGDMLGAPSLNRSILKKVI